MSRRRARHDERVRRLKPVISRHLGQLARIRLRQGYDQVIGITGSLGKSSTKDSVVEVLAPHFSVDASAPNLNTRMGLLLSLFGQRPGERWVKRWLAAMGGAVLHFLTVRRRYEKLVLEMGVDRPGGMADTLQVFRPDIALFTGVAPAHLGGSQFADEEAIFEEKALLVRSVVRGVAILNRDDPYCLRLQEENLGATLLWYGRRPAHEPTSSLPPGLYFDGLDATHEGISADLHLVPPPDASAPRMRGSARHRLFCPILGTHHIHVLLPAVLTGLVAGLDLEQACKSLRTFALPPGRMNRIRGIHDCTIIDSSFNASPTAVEAALRTLGEYPADRRIALLGSMNELGDASESAHRAIGALAPRHAAMLVTVGGEARWMAEAARAEGMSGNSLQSFDTAVDAGRFLRGVVRRGDVVLVKGSRSFRLEQAIRELLEDQDPAVQRLVS